MLSYLPNFWVTFVTGIIYYNLPLMAARRSTWVTPLFTGPLMTIFDLQGEIGLMMIGQSILNKQVSRGV